MPNDYRPDLPPLPWRLRSLPVRRGYPVPWFVAMVNGDYDFRIADPAKLRIALRSCCCWTCGQPITKTLHYAIGPMCVVTRTTAEMPMHKECAEWTVQACPFLSQRQHTRRTSNLPENITIPGEAILRQPGVVAIWSCASSRVFHADASGVLLKVGEPIAVTWWSHGRPATRAEVLASIDSGYPALLASATAEGQDAIDELTRLRDRAMQYLPKEA